MLSKFVKKVIMSEKLILDRNIARFPRFESKSHLNLAFSLRKAGNMSAKWGPKQEAEENVRRFYQQAGFNQDRVHLHLEQGTKIILVGKENKGQTISGDGLITTTPELTLSLYLADCLPIIITQISQQSSFVGLIHAGWRGTDQRIIEKAIQSIKRNLKVDPSQLLVLVGPGIHLGCYYHPKLASRLSKKSGWRTFIRKGFIDLVGYNIQQAMEAGVQQQNFLIANECTACSRSNQQDYLFFSHYRSKKTGEKEGRFAAAVALKAAS